MQRKSLMVTVGAAFGAALLVVPVHACKSPSTSSSLRDAVPDRPEFSGVKLTMSGNPNTGEISAVFSFTSSEFNPGDQVELRYDVVSTPPETKINCSKLRGTATVMLEGHGKAGTFTKKVDKSLFADPVQPDPQLAAKADMGLLATNPGPLRVEGCLLRPGTSTTLAAAAAQPAAEGFALAGEDAPIVQYGKVCAERLGELPAFDCMDDTLFKEIPITVTTGETTASPTSAVGKCDHPIYLPTGGGYCKPWARIGRIKTGPDTTAAVVCRRYWSSEYPAITGKDDPFFNDVAVIQHNRKTGETCWFQALGYLYAKRVPPPSETAVPDTAQAEHPRAKPAASFWLTPAATANINCIGCHDADPWMHSPYVREAKDEAGDVWLPSSPRSKYIMLGGKFGFDKWPTAYSVKPTTNAECTSCHRIGSLQGCDIWAADAGGVGTYLHSEKTTRGKTFPTSHWMPPKEDETFATLDEWKETYAAAHKAILDCCNVKDTTGKRILGKTGEFQSLKPNYGKVMSQSHIDQLKAKGCVVTPISEVKETF